MNLILIFGNSEPRTDLDSSVLFTPLEDLSLIPSEQHIALTHPGFPKYGVRIKKSHDFCDTTVKWVSTPPTIHHSGTYEYSLVHTRDT